MSIGNGQDIIKKYRCSWKPEPNNVSEQAILNRQLPTKSHLCVCIYYPTYSHIMLRTYTSGYLAASSRPTCVRVRQPALSRRQPVHSYFHCPIQCSFDYNEVDRWCVTVPHVASLCWENLRIDVHEDADIVRKLTFHFTERLLIDRIC